MKPIYILIGTLFLFASCEDIINPELDKAEPVVAIDAMITNKPETQVIRITRTIPYDDNENLPDGISGAQVTVTDSDGTVYSFTEDVLHPGDYLWTPPTGDSLGIPGKFYTLEVVTGTDVYTSTTYMAPAPVIDSVTFTFQEATLFQDEGYTGEFWARDFAGEGNTYWIRAIKNGVPLNKPAEINLAYDGAFGPGSGQDGVVFIPPIRQGINPTETDDQNRPLPGFLEGDSVYVEIHSISLPAFNFLNEVIDNTNRPTGVGSLFTTPLTNVSTNITNQNAAGTPVVGFFNVASVHGLGRKVGN